MNKEDELKALETEFINMGYFMKSIRSIENSNEAETIQDKIDNLKGEQQYWCE